MAVLFLFGKRLDKCLVRRGAEVVYFQKYDDEKGRPMTFNAQVDGLKEKENLALLAHYYVHGDIQGMADYVGDSFYLAQLGQKIPEDTILMAGVYFMGETLKVLNPDKRIVMLNPKADCPMAHMVTGEDIAKVREEVPDLAVVCYVNSTLETKALSDVCVTSSNAVKICESLPQKNIFFIPDGNLGQYVSDQVRGKNIIIYDTGCCPKHHKITAQDIQALKDTFPEALVLTHPESRPEVTEISDFVGSTKGIIQEAGRSDAKAFIIVTVNRMAYALEKAYPDKTFHYLEDLICEDMDLPTKEDVLTALNRPENEVHVDPELAERALIPLQRMLELGSQA